MSASSAIPLPRTSPLAQGSLLAGFGWFVVFYNLVVIVWGALVRASGSGAGCGNHWPLCNGQVIPVSPGFHTLIEFTHRMMVGGSTFLVLALLVWTLRATIKGQAARAFVVASTLLLLNEAFLGALLVKLNYVNSNPSTGRVALLAIHLGNTLLLMGALTLTAHFLSTGQSWSDLPLTRSLIGMIEGLATTLCVGISGSVAALGDTLFPAASLHASFAQDLAASSPMLLRLRLVHPAMALITALFAVWLVAHSRRGGKDATTAFALEAGFSACLGCNSRWELRTCCCLRPRGCNCCICWGPTCSGSRWCYWPPKPCGRSMRSLRPRQSLCRTLLIAPVIAQHDIRTSKCVYFSTSEKITFRLAPPIKAPASSAEWKPEPDACCPNPCCNAPRRYPVDSPRTR
jgi:cytochrome c oxidase assembly protein subunit 15